MNLQEIKTAIENGQPVNWASSFYYVVLDKKGQYLIQGRNGYCVSLTWADGVTLNGKEEQFYIPFNN